MLGAAIGQAGASLTGTAGRQPDDMVRPSLTRPQALPAASRVHLGASRHGLAPVVSVLRGESRALVSVVGPAASHVRGPVAPGPRRQRAGPSTQCEKRWPSLRSRGLQPETSKALLPGPERPVSDDRRDRAGPQSPPPLGRQPLDRDRRGIGHQAVASSRHLDSAVPNRPRNGFDHQLVNAVGAGRGPRRLNPHMSVSNPEGWRPVAASRARASEREVIRADVRVRLEGNSDTSPQVRCHSSTPAHCA